MRSYNENGQHDVLICLLQPGEHLAPKDTHSPPSVVLRGRLDSASVGNNGLFIRPGRLIVDALFAPGKAPVPIAPFDYDFLYFSGSQRVLRRKSMAILQSYMDEVLDTVAGMPREKAEDLVPFIILVLQEGRVSLYHFADLGHQGALYLCFERLAIEEYPSHHPGVDALLAQAYRRQERCHELLNDNSGFSRWRAEYELERKLTFSTVPDTWKLTQDLYDGVLSGAIPGFVPELGLEFQVYDYESHVFEVLSPSSEAGYISFIPQCDGRMTTKRKWFVENAELRKETIIGNQDIPVEGMDLHVKTMTSGRTHRLAAFRRKRFDVHIESMNTGHIFGIYFDICRIVGDEQSVMSQCEVEYCRSRTLFDIQDVYEEFEMIADYTEAFLARQKVRFERNLYSKLDFVRDHFTATAA
jgi:hypothetical protein